MCLPKTPSIPETPQSQAAKGPDAGALTAAATRNRKQSQMGAGTLLTGPSGVAPGTLNTGRNSLLGG